MEPPQTGEVERLVSRTERIPEPPFETVVETATHPRTVWSPPGDATVVGSGAAATVTADGPNRFAQVREAAEALFASGNVHAGTEAARPRLFGGFAFHDQGAEREPWRDFPDARFVFPRMQVTYADNGTWLTVNAVGPEASVDAVEERLASERDRLAALEPRTRGRRPGIASRTRTTALEDWRDGVEAAVERIRAGDLRKVVLAQALEATLESPLSLADTLVRLGEKYPDCHRFLVESPDGETSLFGATPEQLVSVRGRTVETDALAGTTGRGETPAEDEWLARELMNSEKNVHEHELVAETIREQLAPFAASVATGERQIRRLATVQHLWTPITAKLHSDSHVLDLVEALHPTPAVGGLPPEEALATIRETEPFDRGWYAAPVGWVDAAGYGSFAVALRSAVATRNVVTLFAGVGIVADSDPDREWDEVQLKYRPILDELEAED